jgi:predicted AAA+ superfamily ATPase
MTMTKLRPSTIIKRKQADVLRARLAEPRRFMQVVAGPRQVGKSTMVEQVVSALKVPVRSESADEPTLRGSEWIAQQWEAARSELDARKGGILVLDEVQKIPNWSETVKRMWDEDTRKRRPLKVVLLGSAPLLIARGLSESLAGRFETITMPHWSYSEMAKAFGFTLDEYIFYGGYPGAAPFINDHQRWRRYVIDSLVETSVSRDVLLLSRIDKPALLRRLFDLACRYSGQQLSYTKMLGQLQDAGNTTTLAHYLDLLEQAGLVRGLTKYAGDVARQRGSSPKLQVLNTALMSATSNLTSAEARADKEFWGRLVESAVGAHLANAELMGECTVQYWRDSTNEVDFVVTSGRTVTAIEVKSGVASLHHSGTAAFVKAFKPQKTLLVGGDGISIEAFLTKPVEQFIGSV